MFRKRATIVRGNKGSTLQSCVISGVSQLVFVSSSTTLQGGLDRSGHGANIGHAIYGFHLSSA